MENEIWEQIGQFLNKLRCENITRDTAVEVPGYKDMQNETEQLHKKCETIVQHLHQEDQQIILEWMAKLEGMNSLEGQKAYCQGYIDCILLLSGMKLLRQDLSSKEILNRISKWERNTPS